MRKAISFLLFFCWSLTGFAQIRLRRPIIETPDGAEARPEAHIGYIVVLVTLAVALVVYICLRIRKRVLHRRYAGSSKSKSRHKKRSSRSSGSADASATTSSSRSSSSGSSRSSSSGASRASSSGSSRRSSGSSRSRSGSSSSGGSSSSSERRGSRWTAALDKQASGLLPGQPDVFYMPSPDAEGKFLAPIQKFRTNDRLYQFVVLPDTPAEAVLRFAGNETDLRAAHVANSPEWQMMCEVNGTPDAEETGFTQQPGQAVLEEGVWTMKEKIQIRFNG